MCLLQSCQKYLAYGTINAAQDDWWHSEIFSHTYLRIFWHYACAFWSPHAPLSVLHISKLTVDLNTPPPVSYCSSPTRQHLLNSPQLAQSAHEVCRAPVQHQSIIKGGWALLAWIFSHTLLGQRGGCHFSVTAAAMGTRMVPRAVAASSSISVFSRLITHSMASRPWSTTKD